ncbi:MAG: PD-(D/E)XK nuclease family protein, partial [Emergencia sp.]|nr:PD-(D/E)XK nuclease family protein [Emergencia sp.]
IIDYKTGQESFRVEEARGGYRLQLMLYLKAAQENVKKPAGVFYFKIGDPRVDLTGIAREKIFEKISKEMKTTFRLDGIMVNDGQIIDGIAGEFEGFSDIVPLRATKDGVKATSDGFLLSEEEFAQLQSDIDRQIEKLCGQLADGRIEIRPKKTDRESPCTYCEYKGICRFDLAFPGCNYEVIR